MRDNLVKQKDLQDQLEEAKTNEMSEPDLGKAAKGKGGGKAATKTPSEIMAEIRALQSIELNGWVLIDFPRTIN